MCVEFYTDFLRRPYNTVPRRHYQWRIQDFCEGDAAGVWPPIFSEEMTPTFLRQIVSAHIGVPRIFRGWVRQGYVDPGFLVGGRWRGRRPRTMRDRREAPERREGEVWGGAPQPLPGMGVWGIALRKFLKFNLQICAF